MPRGTCVHSNKRNPFTTQEAVRECVLLTADPEHTASHDLLASWSAKMNGGVRGTKVVLAHRESDMLQKSFNLCSANASFPWTLSPKVPLSSKRPAFPPCK